MLPVQAYPTAVPVQKYLAAVGLVLPSAQSLVVGLCASLLVITVGPSFGLQFGGWFLEIPDNDSCIIRRCSLCIMLGSLPLFAVLFGAVYTVGVSHPETQYPEEDNDILIGFPKVWGAQFHTCCHYNKILPTANNFAAC